MSSENTSSDSRMVESDKGHLHQLTEYDTVEGKSYKCLEKEQSHPAKGITGSPVVILMKMQEQKIIIYCCRVVVASERVEDLTCGMLFEEGWLAKSLRTSPALTER